MCLSRIIDNTSDFIFPDAHLMYFSNIPSCTYFLCTNIKYDLFLIHILCLIKINFIFQIILKNVYTMHNYRIPTAKVL